MPGCFELTLEVEGPSWEFLIPLPAVLVADFGTVSSTAFFADVLILEAFIITFEGIQRPSALSIVRRKDINALIGTVTQVAHNFGHHISF